MKRHSKVNGIHKEFTIDSKVTREPMPSEVDAETLRQIVGGDQIPVGDEPHKSGALEP